MGALALLMVASGIGLLTAWEHHHKDHVVPCRSGFGCCTPPTIPAYICFALGAVFLSLAVFFFIKFRSCKDQPKGWTWEKNVFCGFYTVQQECEIASAFQLHFHLKRVCWKFLGLIFCHRNSKNFSCFSFSATKCCYEYLANQDSQYLPKPSLLFEKRFVGIMLICFVTF